MGAVSCDWHLALTATNLPTMQLGKRSGFSTLRFVRFIVGSFLLLFLIPIFGAWFASHAIDHYDAELRAELALALAHSGVRAEQSERVATFFAQHSASELCLGPEGGQTPLLQEYIAQGCSDIRQFAWIAEAAKWALALGLLSVGCALACAALAWRFRAAQYASFLVGWQVLKFACAIQIVLQGFLATMLSYWAPTLSQGRIDYRFVVLAAVFVLGAVLVLLMALFPRRWPGLSGVNGVPILRQDAPQFWERIDELARRLSTQPPDQILGGISESFFVTESPLLTRVGVVTGRTLYVNLTLLRWMTRAQGDAVFSQELAHFNGGDTEHSRRLVPLLIRFHGYLEPLSLGGLSAPVFYFMAAYRSLFELALRRTSREREERADRMAAEATSPEAVGLALLQVSAYADYCEKADDYLFSEHPHYAQVDAVARFDAGFVAHLASVNVAAYAEQVVPHPFDSHPPTLQRLQAVGASEALGAWPQLAREPVSSTWLSAIPTGAVIERELWRQYEAPRRAPHDESLAYRYLPSTEDERAVVEGYFPRREIMDSQGKPLMFFDCEGIHWHAWPAAVAWDEVDELDATPAENATTLVFQVISASGTSTLTLPLQKQGGVDDAVFEAINTYLIRRRAARQAHEERSAKSHT